MRRRRGTRQARFEWVNGQFATLARAINSQAGMAAITPRAARIISLVDLAPGRRYVDIGCGTAAYAHLLADRAGLEEPPVCMDIVAGPGPVDFVGWPEQLPFADGSIDVITSLYFIRRFEDDVVHNFATEISRVLAPGGSALLMEVAPVKADWLEKLHRRLLSGGCAAVDLRGWGRMAALLTECGFDQINLVNAGPFFLPPIPRIGVLLRRSPVPLHHEHEQPEPVGE